MAVLARVLPRSLQGYQAGWLRTDVVAGVTLAAVAIPETMGYTSIAQTPVVTGLYTIIFPTLVFALLGSSRLLVVGADSATAAILAAGLAGIGIAGLQPNSAEWLAWTSLVALVCGGLLVLARLLKLGFLGDFLSASVLVGFLTGVGIQVLAGQIPDMLGIAKGSGNWFEQQWSTITHALDANGWTLAFAAGTLIIIVGFERFLPKVPGAVVAVIVSIILSNMLNASGHGVAVVGAVESGFPPIGLPDGLTWSDIPKVLGIAFSCFVLIIAQSAATSRSFAMKHSQTVDVNRDIVGLSGANFAAGLTGTFAVNGSPTKTQILDEQKGRTQVANMTMSLIALVVVLFLTGLLTDMPKAVLASIVFLIGIGLIDLGGLRRIRAARVSEFAIAVITAVVVFAIGVEAGIILAIVLSIIEIVRRAYAPKDFLVGTDSGGGMTYVRAEPGRQSLPGLLVFRFDAQLFFANASRFSDQLDGLLSAAPTDVRWLVLDCSSLNDIDYSAGITIARLIRALHADGRVFALAQADPDLLATLEKYGTLADFDNSHIYSTVAAAVTAFRSSSLPSASPESE
ncbi:SulP family inorganic anion transporter [Aldersonia sp. NBC_00410]|uniref:SulP family inorganic anion transporter n=1 Tax=Aldersonia sp. NBC_00410 TaxID=2975954 RepID=UPI00225B173F|nr:SulP family inorganic anion transporter [Aldersonia sp. NBC_00410]MCX5044124.1 SulP family inorganic anion transporter [Aldersonia sp. NBC_00410]